MHIYVIVFYVLTLAILIERKEIYFIRFYNKNTIPWLKLWSTTIFLSSFSFWTLRLVSRSNICITSHHIPYSTAIPRFPSNFNPCIKLAAEDNTRSRQVSDPSQKQCCQEAPQILQYSSILISLPKSVISTDPRELWDSLGLVGYNGF